MSPSPSPPEKPILVTGGAGFIGSHLTERLLADGESVIVIDDVSTGTWTNLDAIRAHPRLECLQSTVAGCSALAEIVSRCKAIYHLAAAVGVERVLESPVRAMQTNLHDTEAVLEAASKSRVPILITSTSEVYGRSAREAFSEEDDLLIGSPAVGRWSYACSKLMDEFLAMGHARERGLPVVIARLFNTVGPRQSGKYGMVLPRFIEAARAGQPLRVFGDGLQTRCFCWIGDTIESLTRLQRCTAARGEVVNVGSTEEVTIHDLARQVIEVFRSNSIIERVPYTTAYAPGFEDMPRRRPNVEKLLRLTGYRPRTSLRGILENAAQEEARTGRSMPPSEQGSSRG